MGKKADFKWTRLYLMAITTVFFTWSCGGGGGGGEAPSPRTPASVDQRTAELTSVMVLSMQDARNLSDAAQTPDPGTPASTASAGQSAIRWANIVNQEDILRAGSFSETVDCLDAGTMAMSTSWTGPELSEMESSEVCEIQDMSSTLTFSNCLNGDMSSNGTATSTFEGSLCEPTTVFVSYSNFTMGDGELYFGATALDVAMTDMQWSATDDSPSRFKSTYDGDLAINEHKMEFDQYVLEMSSDASTMTISVNGDVTGGCIDGWVTVSTITPIQINLDDTCPTQGHIQITGAAGTAVDVVYNSDGSMDIGGQHYSACDAPEISDQCQ